ncbi:MAG: metal-dependent transcriptional regulator [candidate division KSB1 bacterium]|nr:metal-dependent transcriptional regulator [candidate division KSB1 bacterium]MDZ7305224.1 metal-dependent transcriptional regulator [candidate division KSB1 bacterium]MDZ7314335.1 metal-dependent transcriptional regulator [candidate division KSB1 bacterium]
MKGKKPAAHIWKSFEENTITHSSAHHLMAIHELLDRNGYARVTDVAKFLGITRGSVSVTLKALKNKGYVTEDDNKFLRLTMAGSRMVETVAANRHVLLKFLRDVLALNPEQAEIDACKVEHLLSQETGVRLLQFLDFLFSENRSATQFISAFRSAEHDNRVKRNEQTSSHKTAA